MVNTTQRSRSIATVVFADSAPNLTWGRARLIRVQPDARVLYMALRSIDSDSSVLIKTSLQEFDLSFLTKVNIVGVYKGEPVVYYINKNSYWLYPLPNSDVKIDGYLSELAKGWQIVNIGD